VDDPESVVVPGDNAGVAAPLIVGVEVAVDDNVTGFGDLIGLSESEVAHEFGFHEGGGGWSKRHLFVAGFEVVHDKYAAIVWPPDVFVAVFDIGCIGGFDFGLEGENLGRDFFIELYRVVNVVDYSGGCDSGAEEGGCDDDFGSAASHVWFTRVLRFWLRNLETENVSEASETVVPVFAEFLGREGTEFGESGEDFGFDGLGGFDGLSVGSAERFGENLLDESKFESGVGSEFESSGGLSFLHGVAPENCSAAFGWDDAVDGVFLHHDLVGDGDADCATGAAFADDDADDGDGEFKHFEH